MKREKNSDPRGGGGKKKKKNRQRRPPGVSTRGEEKRGFVESGSDLFLRKVSQPARRAKKGSASRDFAFSGGLPAGGEGGASLALKRPPSF